jgi:cytochrome c553
MKKTLWVVVVVVGMAVVFASAALYAGTKAPDVIKMENKAYAKHEKGIVEFSHKKHVAEYKSTCGDCHHDKDGKPLASLKDGDNVQGCIECHKKPGEKPKGKDAPKLTDKETLEYHAEAMHKNCQGCHKEMNKKNNNQNAPTTCVKCHPKTT